LYSESFLSLKITHFSTWDVTGGAARASYRLHQSLLSLGHDSRMVVLNKNSRDDTVAQFVPSGEWSVRFKRGLRRRYLARAAARLASLPAGSTIFTDDRTQYGAEPSTLAAGRDVINLHWVAGFIDCAHFFSSLPANLPAVWTLHDMNAFTGGCHYSFDCDQFMSQCGKCPQLASSRVNDLSRQIWNRKRSPYESLSPRRLHFVTPSRWLERELRRSGLLGQADATVIPYSLDTQKFQPRDRILARRRFGVPDHAKVVLFVADWAGEKRKGLALLLDALRGLAHIPDLCLVAIGRQIGNFQPHCRYIPIDFIHDEENLSHLYSAADVFVIPSLQDNLPNTAIEAQSCGVPTVCFAAGGLPEIVLNAKTGFVAPTGDIAGLRDAIAALLNDPERRATMSLASRQNALQQYSFPIQGRRYIELYQHLLSGTQ
jgi:glycosyltransferase involved in cell wall biosynthesis